MNKTVNQKSNAGSFKSIFDGFRRISPAEQIAYLRYLDLLIERQSDGREKRQLQRFKSRLEKEIQKHLINA
jgi:hypothetical protein